MNTLAPRYAALRDLSHEDRLLDQALVLRFPAPNSYTGEDCAELHVHGGRAVVEAVSDALSALGDDEALRGCYVAVSARDGRVTLSGVVRDASQLASALQTAMAVPGVRAVDNALEVAGR